MNLSIENWLNITSLFFVGIGGAFAFWQWRNSIKIKRAEFIDRLLGKLRFDKELSDAIYIVDYNQEWYDNSFHCGNLEHTIDTLFSYIDYICYLKSTGNISITEFKIFQYDVHRICISNSSRAYLWNLYHFSQKNKSDCSFQHLIDYGIESNVLPEDFKSNKSLYPKYLYW